MYQKYILSEKVKYLIRYSRSSFYIQDSILNIWENLFFNPRSKLDNYYMIKLIVLSKPYIHDQIISILSIIKTQCTNNGGEKIKIFQ